MILKILLTIIAGLVAGDGLCFIIYCLCKAFSDESQTNIRTENVFKEYLRFALGQLKTNRKNFLAYYLLLDLVTLGITFAAVFIYGATFQMVAALVFGYGLIALTFVDARTQYLPDIITKPLIAIGLGLAYFEVFVPLKDAALGAALGYGILWSVNTAFRILRGKEGMGYGDFKLLAAIGAWVGYTQLPFIILSSSIIGIFVAVAMARLPGKDLSQATPFGPSLAIAGIVSLFWGQAIIGWYLGLFAVGY